MSQATVFEALCGGRQESRVVLDADGTLRPVISTVEWLETRCIYHPQLHYLTFDLGEYLGGGVAPSDLISAWCWDMADFLLQSSDPWAAKLLAALPLKGIGLGGEVLPIGTESIRPNVLDVQLTIDVFQLEQFWFALISDSDETKHPVVVEVEDLSKLQEINTAQLISKKTQWYWDTDKWIGPENIRVSTNPRDRGRGVVYYDGMHAYCPVTGRRMIVSPT